MLSEKKKKKTKRKGSKLNLLVCEAAVDIDKGAQCNSGNRLLTIIPQARMGSESIAHEAEGRMGYWLRGHEGERNDCFSKIQLVGQKYRE